MSIILIAAIIAAVSALLMAVAWQLALRTGNSGWADVFWSFTVGIGGVIAALSQLGTAGSDARRWLLVGARGSLVAPPWDPHPPPYGQGQG